MRTPLKVRKMPRKLKVKRKGLEMGFFPGVFMARQTARTQPEAADATGTMQHRVEENMTHTNYCSDKNLNQNMVKNTGHEDKADFCHFQAAGAKLIRQHAVQI